MATITDMVLLGGSFFMLLLTLLFFVVQLVQTTNVLAALQLNVANSVSGLGSALVSVTGSLISALGSLATTFFHLFTSIAGYVADGFDVATGLIRQLLLGLLSTLGSGLELQVRLNIEKIYNNAKFAVQDTMTVIEGVIDMMTAIYEYIPQVVVNIIITFGLNLITVVISYIITLVGVIIDYVIMGYGYVIEAILTAIGYVASGLCAACKDLCDIDIIPCSDCNPICSF